MNFLGFGDRPVEWGSSMRRGGGSKSLSGKRKEPKPKLLSPDIFRWGRGLPREGVGAKKFGMSLEAREIKLFGRDIPGFCRDIPGAPEKFEKKKVCVQFSSPSLIPPFDETPGETNFVPGMSREFCQDLPAGCVQKQSCARESSCSFSNHILRKS